MFSSLSHLDCVGIHSLPVEKQKKYMHIEENYVQR